MPAPRLLPVLAGALLLTGCGLEKPTPLVTVVSGGSSVNDEAAQYCFEGQDVEAERGAENACYLEEDFDAEVLRVKPGAPVGVDVSKHLSDTGWRVVLAPASGAPAEDSPSSGRIAEEHYFSFPANFPNGEPLRLIVQEVGEGQTTPTGVWEFILAPE